MPAMGNPLGALPLASQDLPGVRHIYWHMHRVREAIQAADLLPAEPLRLTVLCSLLPTRVVAATACQAEHRMTAS